MHRQTIVVLLIGLAVSAYGLDLSHATKASNKLDPETVSLITKLYAQSLSRPINHVFANLVALGHHLYSEISKNGIHTADGRTIHPTDEQLRGFFSGLWNDALKPPLENAISTVSLLAAQVLAGIGMNGVNLGIGKRDLTEEEMRGFFGGLWNDALKPPLENAISTVSLLAAQVLAGIGMNGVNLGIGKRDLTEAELRGFFDALGQAVNDVFSNVIQKPLEDALAGGALMLAQALAGIGTNGINLSGLLGKRDVIDLSGHEDELRGILGTIGGAVVGGLTGVWNGIFQVPLENFVQNTALTAAGWLANIGTGGANLGKRSADARGAVFDSLFEHASGLYANQVKPIVENALNAAALHLAGVLANFSQNGIGRR